MGYPVYPNTFSKDISVGDKTITVSVGKFSEQAAAAVLMQCGETVVFTTVALGRKVDLGYFPLGVEFVEKLYASGIIKGSRWVKRDGRPNDDVVLKARVVDRTLRPLFPEGITNEVQIINTVFSYDGQNDPDMLGLLGSSIGVSISEIPFEGPVAGLRVGYNKETEQFMFNPTNEELTKSDLDLIVSGTADSIVMVEAGANEITEAVMIDAMIKAQEILGKVCDSITAIQKEIGKPKVDLVTVNTEAETAAAKLQAWVLKGYLKEIQEIVNKEGRLQPSNKAEVIATIVADYNKGKAEEEMITEKAVSGAMYALTTAEARRMIIEDGERPDGRKTDEIRPIWTEVDVFPRTHGSAMFKRGATQAVTITTLGSPSLSQLVEGIDGEETRRYIHHYNMPPYASGEAGRFGYPKRREIGHGALAERALLPMIPSQKDFPYTILVVSEIVSSNGSTSQASICGSTMSLMAAGVPIKRPVAGIAMGLMSDGTKYKVLSDIQGLEDHVGDMDFKVAGTTEGITAIQMDIKLTGLNRQILEEALEQAKVGRLHILGKMLEAIAEPRKQLSAYAPKIQQLEIPGDRIGEMIGPGGKMIKSIIEATGAQIDVDEDEERGVGLVNVSSPDQAKIDKAVSIISNMMRTISVGEEFDGTVTRVEGYGAFVEYLPGREGLVHVSRMSGEYVADANEVAKFGDTVHVWIAEVKDDGKIGLSMVNPADLPEPRQGGGGDRGDRGDRRGGGDRGGFRGGRGGGYGGDRGGSRGGDRGGFRGGDRGGRG
ncbi:polyribonucleotide nucleotidyltransferase [Candidatus Woesebacteria bacterium]|nr:polyribonucleotide nucleotidyltransferase [Candidatus Woesebacteria bacterium]